MSHVYMQIDDIPGNVSSGEYKDWIKIQSLQFGQSRSVNTPVGCANDRSHGTTRFSEMTISKQLDPATHELLTHTWSGKIIPEIEIHICHDGNDASPIGKYIINDCIIASNEHNVTEGGLPSEVIEFNFAQIEFAYIGRDSDNSTLSPQITGFDLNTAKLS